MSINQRLTIPSKYRGPAFRAIESLLREDPVLVSVVKTWRSREGFDTDMQMPAWDMQPMVALSPAPLPNKQASEADNFINFTVNVELYVPGTCYEDIDALWSAIEDAIVKTKPFRSDAVPGQTVASFLCSCLGNGGVQNLRAVAPAFYPVDLKRKDNDAVSQSGLGTLTCWLRRPA